MRAVLALLVVAGCTTPEKRLYPGDIIPVETGFAVTGSGGREISFGRAAPGAIIAMEKLLGQGRVQTGPCLVVTWRDGLQAHFTPDFSGWVKDGESAGRLCHSS